MHTCQLPPDAPEPPPITRSVRARGAGNGPEEEDRGGTLPMEPCGSAEGQQGAASSSHPARCHLCGCCSGKFTAARELQAKITCTACNFQVLAVSRAVSLFECAYRSTQMLHHVVFCKKASCQSFHLFTDTAFPKTCCAPQHSRLQHKEAGQLHQSR